MLDLPEQPKETYYQRLINPVCDLSIAAGHRIMEFYRSGEHETVIKADHSPVTDADIAAHHMIVENLRRWAPDIPIVSEENASQPDVAKAKHFWLVDPLDGTKSFIRRSDEFTVNIALMEGDRPVFGAIYIPVTDTLYYGSEAYGAFRQKPNDAPRHIRARTQPEEGATVLVSQSHNTAATDAFMENLTVAETMRASSSLKFCLVAEGTADVYPRYGRTMEWDTAAGHAIINAAGGRVETTDGKPLLYGKPGFENDGFIVWGAEELS